MNYIIMYIIPNYILNNGASTYTLDKPLNILKYENHFCASIASNSFSKYNIQYLESTVRHLQLVSLINDKPLLLHENTT